MSNSKFRLSDMIPNAWFSKLKDIGKRRKHTTTPSKKKKQSSSKPNQINPRKSYYFTRNFNPNPNNTSLEPPRQSSKHETRKRRTTASSSSSSVSVSVSAGCSCRTKEQHSSSPFHSSTTETESPVPQLRTDRVLIPIESSFDEMVSLSTSFDDIVIDVDKNSLVRKDDKLEERYQHEHEYEYDNTFSKLQLAPIITKKKQHKPKKEEKQKQRSPGVKLRVKSPRIVTRNYGNQKSGSRSGYRRSISDSLAIVKSSFDPQKDFRESMVEMIVENNIRTSKDLENLLACYLSLNSDEYHGVIIKVFKQIWFDLTQIS